MSFDDAIKALSLDALKNVKDGYVLGLGKWTCCNYISKIIIKIYQNKKNFS